MTSGDSRLMTDDCRLKTVDYLIDAQGLFDDGKVRESGLYYYAL